MTDNTSHRKNSARESEKRFLVLLFNSIFVVDPYDIWTTLKMVLTPLNVNRYRLFKKLTALTVRPTIRCPLNVSELLHK